MRVHLFGVGFVVLLAGGAFASDPDRRKHVSAVMVWSGEREDPLPEVRGGVILDNATWQRFWTYANLPGKCPKVDFSHDVVVVTSHAGWSRVYSGWLTVDATGAATADWFSQPERVAGSYGVIVVPRAGITSINGRTVGGKL